VLTLLLLLLLLPGDRWSRLFPGVLTLLLLLLLPGDRWSRLFSGVLTLLLLLLLLLPGDRWSRLTFLVYLNDDFEGGATTYYTANEQQVGPCCYVMYSLLTL
jgi:hypothetical protein